MYTGHCAVWADLQVANILVTNKLVTNNLVTTEDHCIFSPRSSTFSLFSADHFAFYYNRYGRSARPLNLY